MNTTFKIDFSINLVSEYFRDVKYYKHGMLQKSQDHKLIKPKIKARGKQLRDLYYNLRRRNY